MENEALIQHCEGRLKGLKNERNSWWVHWREIADYILPRRYKWLVTPNEASRGSPLNSRIIDSTGTIALRTLSSGMMSGITSPTRPWFKLRVEETDQDDQSNPTNLWLAEVEKRMGRVFAESNFYPSIAQLYQDLGAFGSGCMLIYEDFEDVIRCYNPCAGEYYFANSSKNRVDTVYREFVMTVRQLCDEFGEENLTESTRQMYRNGKADLEKEIKVAHALEPNMEPRGGLSKRFKYREVYWEVGRSGNRILRLKGFVEAAAMTPRWDLVGNDAYGRSPAMDALGDVKQLQQETKRKAQAIDKLVNPPLLADIQLRNQPASTLPGGVTFVTNLANNHGMKPVYTVQPPVQELMMDIQQIQERIRQVFFNDLFMMFQNLQAEPRSAAAVDARREEKLVMLGPVLERFENEALDIAIDRTFGIMYRGGLLPSPPPEVERVFVRVEYVSMLAEAMRATGTAAIERLLAQAGSIAAVDPQAMDVVDVRETLQEYGTLLSVPPKLIRSDDAIKLIQEKRARDIAAEQAVDQGTAAVQGAKVLSETDVGGGLNALQMMTGGGLQ